ncbi:SusC/RagA family TonB-linked outer membrane protein [Mangrovimonas aestuarii]|uniref:SusC/RagA family TonB-linked outer membrane protein n=1 Tax=Mangrovimonas aestuarii TaxID=3018443 RepID=UPI002377D8E3|nr:SusC/RagA family TonB-linked outer membrane protein [Mangrovimonas aestuarii]
MKLKLKWISTLLMALVIQFSYAQEKQISGTVTSEVDGLPLPGVNVIVEGTNRGVQTDFDGNYAIMASTGEVLVFSFIGMQEAKVTVGESATINLALKEDVAALDEVVVVGYGTATKQSFTGTAAAVETENIEAKSFSNVTKALAGEVAGVSVINTSGQPGTSAVVRIRGFGSVNGNRAPLYVVDGVPFQGSINSINPSDIESTTILKDATATAIYGARGANGVVMITTKRGKSGQSNIEVDFKTGYNFSLLPRQDVIKSPEQYIELSWEGLYNKAVAQGQADPVGFANSQLFGGEGINAAYNMWNVANGGELIDPATGEVRPGVTRKYNPENWEDYGFQTSLRQEGNIRFYGGNDKTRYFSSFGFLEDVGYVINSDYTRYSTRLNVTHKPKDWLTANANLGYTISEVNNNGQTADSGSVFWFVDNIPSIYPLYLRDADGNIVADPIFGGNQFDYGIGRGFGALTNSIADATYNKSRSNRNELNGNFSFDIDITNDLRFESRFGLQYSNNRGIDQRNPFYGSAADQNPPGALFRTDSEVFSTNFLQLLRYKKEFGAHSLEALAAHESTELIFRTFSAGMSGVVDPNIPEFDNYTVNSGVPGSSKTDWALESYFGQVNYDYDNKYYLSGSVRRDGSSRFINSKWGTFGSIGASWIITNENFMSSDLFTFLKLKASYGLVGDQGGVGEYNGFNGFNVTNLNDQISLPVGQNGTPDLTWETSKMFQTGVEFSLGKYVDGTIDYFIKNTDDLIFQRRIGPSAGLAIITVNDGQLRNSGLEFDFTGHIINSGDFNLDLTVNGAVFDNEITKMPFDPSTGAPKVIDNSNSPFGWSEGHSIYDYYMPEWAGVDAADGAPMWYSYYDDANGNGTLDSNELIQDMELYLADNPNANVEKTVTKLYQNATNKYVGKSSIPSVRGAFRLTARYKKFDFSTQFLYSLGGYSYDGQYSGLMRNGQVGGNNWHKDILNRWQQPGDITDVPRLSDEFSSSYATENNASSLSTRFLTRGDYLSLNNIRLGYTLEGSLMPKSGIDNVNIFLTGDNLLFLSARDGFNPSTSESGNTSTYTYSPLSTVTLGARVKF